MIERSESGQVTIFLIGISLLVFAIAGIAVDGTRAWLHRRTLQNAADASALAGAGELSSAVYYRSGGAVAELDIDAARRVAAQWVADRGLEVESDYVVDADGVEVVLLGQSPTLFLGLVGIHELPVAAEARAEPVSGPP